MFFLFGAFGKLAELILFFWLVFFASAVMLRIGTSYT